VATKQLPSRTVPMRVLTSEQRRFIEGESGSQGAEGLRGKPPEGLTPQQDQERSLLAPEEHAGRGAKGLRGEEGEGLSVQEVARVGGQGAERPSPRTVVERADGRQLRRIQLYFAADVAKRLKHHCVEHEVDMSAFVNRVVQDALTKIHR
jgi:hypothetical protein